MRLSSIFGRGKARNASHIPDYFDVGGIVYAVGDVHGKLNLLKGLLKRIRVDIERSDTGQQKTLVFMGDYVDRGEDSRGVLAFLSELEIPGCKIVFLRGNHEQQMLDFADDPVEKRRWLDWGGLETLASFDIPPVFPTIADKEMIRVGAEFSTALDPLRPFVEDRTVLWWRIGNVVFSHGGMQPDRPVDEQDPRVLLWGSSEFMKHGGPAGNWYVHGHVIHSKPGIIGNRIAIDTGAYDTGILTVARITDDGCAFLQHSD